MKVLLMAKILFVLPAGGYSGGANSVVQDVLGLRRIGDFANIAVDKKNILSFRKCYSREMELVRDLVEFNGYENLKKQILSYDFVIATVGSQALELFEVVRDINSKKNLNIRMGYYIQDYELLFFERDSVNWNLVRDSYDDAKDVICFAKTDWICQVVEKNHPIKVSRVLPSIDHDYFVPNLASRNGIAVTAMLRLATPRRAPRRTARIFNHLASKHGDSLRLSIFGSSPDELLENGILLDSSVQNHGKLTKEQVAQLLSDSDLFLDLSDYQAFGRTGVESMACGAIPVMPAAGAAPEFISSGHNGYVVDMRSDNLIMDVIDEYINLPLKRKKLMQAKALELASQFSVHRAAISLRNVLNIL